MALKLMVIMLAPAARMSMLMSAATTSPSTRPVVVKRICWKLIFSMTFSVAIMNCML